MTALIISLLLSLLECLQSNAKDDSDIFVFHCSEKQALYFFFSYANDVEILEPLSLRQRFIDMYRRGYAQY